MGEFFKFTYSFLLGAYAATWAFVIKTGTLATLFQDNFWSWLGLVAATGFLVGMNILYWFPKKKESKNGRN